MGGAILDRVIITIDGPAGAGKSTIARKVAKRLGLRFLDTGAMYRAFTWKALEAGIDLRDVPAMADLVRSSTLVLEGERVVLDGRDISREIRAERVTAASRHAADPPELRAEIVRLQRDFGKAGGLVTEGRDQGSDVFPEADYKFHLDASIEERARRRRQELEGRGEAVDFEALKRSIEERDERDRRRPVGALRKAADAIEIDTSAMDPEQVVEAILARIGTERTEGNKRE